ncbi:hypothetical protein COCC4DRAFT_55788 [Bipolaris maydis ATCC 48331]|uniref:Uncharacterized protein n=2 Tax=Cochliobolus heterostrophus TaxID=5016 RepID=M2URQ5_COCH5|nr:uncharacterized protein COCC4DRAFT_55788 [Bipolaris maydis ATCC 48331]EMD96266.1 hypothetical protein COCHEDRAFT_1152331 [Bipolaris maydis C5]ENI11125.1 hypothetical protein COCC4DRAFT_55788 [Bipolaris maydis ATCC 48331]
MSDIAFWNVALILFADVVPRMYRTHLWLPSLILLTPDVDAGEGILHIPALVNVSVPGFVG